MDQKPTDVESESSPDIEAGAEQSTETTQPRSLLDEMKGRAGKLEEAGADEAVKPAKTAKPGDKPGEKTAGDEKKADEVGKAAEDGKTVPLKALQAERQKFADTKRKLGEQVQAKDYEIARLRKALDIAGTELNRRAEAHAKGVTFDPKDEQIRHYELAQRARQESEALQTQFTQALEKARYTDRLDAMKDQLSSEIGEAVAAHQLVSQEQLISAMKRDTRPAREIAAEIEGRILDAARGRLAKPRPPSPTTVRSKSSGNQAARQEVSKAGMLARFAELENLNR